MQKTSAQAWHVWGPDLIAITVWSQGHHGVTFEYCQVWQPKPNHSSNFKKPPHYEYSTDLHVRVKMAKLLEQKRDSVLRAWILHSFAHMTAETHVTGETQITGPR